MAPKTHEVIKPLLDLSMQLGEGCVWDTKRQCLYFVDIDEGVLYVYEPETGLSGYKTFDKKVTAIALCEADGGIIAALEDCVVLVASSQLPLANSKPELTCSRSMPATHIKYDVLQTSQAITFSTHEARLNEGAVDPAGRFLFGSMTFDVGRTPGRLYSLRKSSSGEGVWDNPVVHDGISVTNGMGWIEEGSKMYFTDIHSREIQIFDYNLSAGSMSNRRVFSRLGDEYGYPDGLCLDNEGGLWTARWSAGKVIRLDSSGKIDVEINLPNSWNVTCCIFGGRTLSDLYITTAACDQGTAPPHGQTEAGKLYVVREIGYTGLERGRFRRS